MKLQNIFTNGKRVDPNTLRRGAKSTDTHIFIQNDMLKFLTEIQINFESKYDKKMMRSKLINIAIMKLVEDMSEMPEDDALKFIRQLNDNFKEKYN